MRELCTALITIRIGLRKPFRRHLRWLADAGSRSGILRRSLIARSLSLLFRCSPSEPCLASRRRSTWLRGALLSARQWTLCPRFGDGQSRFPITFAGLSRFWKISLPLDVSGQRICCRFSGLICSRRRRCMTALGSLKRCVASHPSQPGSSSSPNAKPLR